MCEPIGFQCNMTNCYHVENQWGGDEAPWHDGGVWEIGNRPDQTIEAISCKTEGSDELNGDMTY